jgi:hypothetical protein
MKRITLILVICTIFGSIVFSQDVDSIKAFIIKSQKVVYKASDSTYKYTRFTGPNGKFYFVQGFVDSSYWCGGTISVFSDNPGFVSTKGKYKLFCEHSQSSIDTITTFFPRLDKEFYEKSSVNSYNEFVYSYVLKKFGETGITRLEDQSLRIVYTCELTGYPTSFHFCKIKFDKESAKFYSLSGRSVDYNGVQPVNIDSCFLKSSDIQNTKRLLEKIRLADDLTCSQDYENPWIMEYNNGIEYKLFIISDLCHFNNRNFRFLIGLSQSIKGLNRKYFNKRCYVNN